MVGVTGAPFHASRSLFFCNDAATTEIYTLSLHDALPIWRQQSAVTLGDEPAQRYLQVAARDAAGAAVAEQHRRLCAVAHQRIVDADRAELVDDDGGAAPLRALKERAHQGRLPGAEEAGDDGARNAPAARVFRPAPERPGGAGGEQVERVVHIATPSC